MLETSFTAQKQKFLVRRDSTWPLHEKSQWNLRSNVRDELESRTKLNKRLSLGICKFLANKSFFHLKINKCSANLGIPYLCGLQGWHSGERTCLPPMWTGFDFQTRRHMCMMG